MYRGRGGVVADIVLAAGHAQCCPFEMLVFFSSSFMDLTSSVLQPVSLPMPAVS